MMFGHGANPVFFNKKKKIGSPEKNKNTNHILTIIL